MQNLETAAHEIEAAHRQAGGPVVVPRRTWEDCDRLVDEVFSAFGHCEILVNNAGMSPAYDGLTSVTEDLYDKVHAVNARGPFRLGVLFGETNGIRPGWLHH